jgi:DNA-binding transcriptional LysR family regulator
MFDRTVKGVEPTSYGRSLIRWANAVFDDIGQGISEIEFLSDPSSGQLRIGATEPMIGGILPVILARLSRQYPRMGFQVMPYGASAQQFHDLHERKIDLTLGRALDPSSEDFRTEILFDEPLFVVAGSKSRWVKQRKIKLADLAGELWSMPRLDTVVGRMVSEAFHASGLKVPEFGVTCNSIQMHAALLATNRYLALFPASLLKFGRLGSVKVLPVDLNARVIPVGITALRKRTISPIVQLFIECAREIAEPLVKQKRK